MGPGVLFPDMLTIERGKGDLEICFSQFKTLHFFTRFHTQTGWFGRISSYADVVRDESTGYYIYKL